MLRLPPCAPVENRNEPLAASKTAFPPLRLGSPMNFVTSRWSLAQRQGGLVVKARACNAPLSVPMVYVGMDAATNPEAPATLPASGRRDAMGRPPILLLSGSWRNKQS